MITNPLSPIISPIKYEPNPKKIKWIIWNLYEYYWLMPSRNLVLLPNDNIAAVAQSDPESGRDDPQHQEVEDQSYYME